jgi:RsiW-degrading membrane proteinase PrsW (M82 family)
MFHNHQSPLVDPMEPTPPALDLTAQRLHLMQELDRRYVAIRTAETDMGRAVLEGLRTGFGAPLPGAHTEIVTIDRAEAAIAELQRQLAAIDTEAAAASADLAETSDPTTHCPACRTRRRPGGHFCAACGERLLFSSEAVAARACDRCDKPIEGDSAFCTLCGWRVAISRLPWWRARWVRVFVGGIALYGFCQAVLPHTDFNSAFIAAELVIGSALVPVTFVTYFYERGTTRQGNWEYLPVGFIEEGCKAAVVVWWLRRKDLTSPDKGFVIGAATGMGFAVLETMGTYALNSFLSALLAGDGGSRAVSAMVTELNLRGVLSPLGHGSWTAILAGVMWLERANGRSPFGKRVVLTYIGVSLLHAFYDISMSSHVMLVSFVSGSRVPLPGLLFGFLGFAVIVLMVRMVRRGQDPVAVLIERSQHLGDAAQRSFTVVDGRGGVR